MDKKDFDNEKVLTPANCFEASKYYGTRVLFADTYIELVRRFNRYGEPGTDKNAISGILQGWSDNSMSFRIEGLTNKVFDFIYVLEEPPLIQERPFKNTEEFVQTYKKRWAEHANKDFVDFMSHPTIWIREIDTKKDFMVIGMDEDSITIIDSRQECVGEMGFGGSNLTRTVLTPIEIDMPMLASRFTFLDGSGCVVRIKL